MATMEFKIAADYSELTKAEKQVHDLEKEVEQLANNPKELKIKTDELNKARESLSSLASQLMSEWSNTVAGIEKRVNELNNIEPTFIHRLFGGHSEERKQLLSDLDMLNEKISHAQDAYGKGNDKYFQGVVKSEVNDNYSFSGDNALNKTQEGVEIPVYFKTDEAYNEFVNLRDRVSELKMQIMSYEGDNAGIVALKAELDETVNEFLRVQTEANAAANSFGRFQNMAIEASNALYEVNGHIKGQQQDIAEYEQKIKDAKKALEEAKEAGDPLQIQEQTAVYQQLNSEYEKAVVRLQNLQSEQAELSKKVNELNQKVIESSTLMVKWFGNGDIDQYKEKLSSMPLVMREVVSGVQEAEVKVRESFASMKEKATGAKEAFVAAGGGLKGIGAALKSLAFNPVGIAIMAVVAALKLLSTWFKTSEKGQKTFAYLSGYIGAILKKVMDIGIVVMDALFDMFNAPTKAGKNFASVLLDAVVSSIKAVFAPAMALGKLIASIFDGSFSWEKTKAEINNVVSAYEKAGKNIKLVINSTGDAVKNGFGGDRFKKAFDFSDVGKMAKAALDERTENLRRAKAMTTTQYDENGNVVKEGGVTAAEMRQRMMENRMKLRDNTLSSEERKKVIEQYEKDVNSLRDIDKKFAQERADRQKLRNDFTTSSIEDLQAYEKALGDIAAIDIRAQQQMRPLVMARNKIATDEKKKSKDGEKQANEAQKAAQRAEEIKMFENKQALELAKLLRENEYLKEQNRIDAMEEGARKSLAQLKLNQKKELDAVIEYEQKLKQKKIDTAKALFKKANPKGVFDASSVDLSLTAAEQEGINERTVKANQQYSNAVKKLLEQFKTPTEKLKEQEKQYQENIEVLKGLIKEQEESNEKDYESIRLLKERLEYLKRENPILKKNTQERINYLKQFGTLAQQQEAINAEYDRKRLEAIDNGASPYELQSIEAGREQALSKNQLAQLKEEINWEEVFSNLDYVSTDHLKRLREQLRAALDMGDITAENARVITEKLNEIDKQIQQKRSTWGQLFGDANQGVGGIVNAIRDQKALNADAKQKREEAITASGIASALRLTAEDIKKDKGEDSEEYLKAQRKADEADKDAQKKNQAAEIAEGVAGSGSLAMTGAIIHGVNDNVQSFAEAAQLLGGKDSEFAKSAAKFAESSQYATDGFEKLKSGDFIGAALSVGQAVNSLGETFGLWSNSNVEDVQKENKRLAAAMALNTQAIERLTKKMGEGDTVNAAKKYEEAMAVMKQNEDLTKQVLLNTGRMYDGHHSTAYYFNDEKTGTLNAINRILGTNYGALGDVLEGDIATLNKLYETEAGRQALKSFTEAISWAESKAGMENNALAEQFTAMLQNFNADAYKEIERAFQNAITGISFDSFKSNFKSALMDMQKDSKDFADDFTQQLTQSFLNAQIEDAFADRIEELYDEWGEAIKGNVLDESELRSLRSKQEALVNDMIAKRNQIAAITGFDDVSTSEASGSINSAKSMSEDTANELIGRLTAVQIGVEAGRAIEQQIFASVEQELTLARLRNEMQAQSNLTLQSVETILADSYLELRGINENTGALVKPMQQMSAHISEIRDKVQSL